MAAILNKGKNDTNDSACLTRRKIQFLLSSIHLCDSDVLQPHVVKFSKNPSSFVCAVLKLKLVH